MTENDVVENGSTRKGAVKIDVSWLTKRRLLAIKDAEGHTSMDSVVRTLLERQADPSIPEWAQTRWEQEKHRTEEVKRYDNTE